MRPRSRSIMFCASSQRCPKERDFASVPELPEMQALSERLSAVLNGARFERIDQLGFTGLKTVRPSPSEILDAGVVGVSRRAKFLVIELDNRIRVLVHLSQAGRMDFEEPAKSTKPRGSVVRFIFDNGLGVLVREYGNERKARWWILGPGDEGPLAGLGPEPEDKAFREFILRGSDGRRLHTLLRDQGSLAGIGRGYVDDILHRAKVSPFSSLNSLSSAQRAELLAAILEVLDEALEVERSRTGGLSEARLGDRFAIHNRAGERCPRCGGVLARVSYESYEIDYCPHCQTHDKVLADRRLSRLLR
jgi:formamidopyrimidine-DNA glycosylase